MRWCHQQLWSDESSCSLPWDLSYVTKHDLFLWWIDSSSIKSLQKYLLILCKSLLFSQFDTDISSIYSLELVLYMSQSKSKSKVKSQKSKGLGVTLFCCVTHHISACATPYLRLCQPTKTFLSNQTSNWAQIFTVDSPDQD